MSEWNYGDFADAADPLAPIIAPDTPLPVDAGTWEGQAPSWGAGTVSPGNRPGGSFWSGGGTPVNTSQGMTPAGGGGAGSWFPWFQTAVQGAVAYRQAENNPWGGVFGARPGTYPGQVSPGYRIDPMTGRPIPASGVSLMGPLSGISMQTWVIIGLGVAALVMLKGKRT